MTFSRSRVLAAAVLAAATLTSVALPAGPPAAARAVAKNPSPAHACVRSDPDADPRAREVLDIARQVQQELDLKSVILRVTVDGHELVTGALGESMTGVPAEPAMHFRAGSVAFPFLGIVLLQLAEEGRIGLDDPVAPWLPDLPQADRITLRMLGDTTSGLADYVTDKGFLDELAAEPFRHWTPEELVAISTGQNFWYEPGTNWSYSHANFVLLGEALERITGTRLDHLLEQRIFGPLGLRQTVNSFTPDIPTPVQHAFTASRGTYEESTFWNPSWTTAPGAVLVSDICDLTRSVEAVGTGALLSPESFRTQLNPGTVGLPGPVHGCPQDVCLPQTEAQHFGLGVIVDRGWILSNPSFSGYAAVEAYQPDEHLAIAVSTTRNCAAPDRNTAQDVAARIAALLAPDHPLKVG
ncbi:serine hydrolase domain-containing protein [Streptomyces sp. NRRL S-495]|uniref:serine hydrolase domain-containing protein n=1 Tax=Streptomyces sp. NRRL S-495 TaxID=1609133 RepID=UPI0005F933D6|nr:serine hydrolase domain-containing protein [Streptomyces sp. NRRL S-495]KJY25322.1 beta-lactamase [Streptomyces sp. NRRL S-495]